MAAVVVAVVVEEVVGPWAVKRAPGARAGPQETELTPRGCAGKVVWFQLASLNSRMEMPPSELPAARRQPVSGGDQERRLTEAVWRAKSMIFCLVGRMG